MHERVSTPIADGGRFSDVGRPAGVDTS